MASYLAHTQTRVRVCVCVYARAYIYIYIINIFFKANYAQVGSVVLMVHVLQ